MKKKFFLGASALLLAAVGVFAGRMSAKTSPSAIYYTLNGSGVCTGLLLGPPLQFITSWFFGFQVTFLTANGVNHVHLWATSTCSSSPIYFQ